MAEDSPTPARLLPLQECALPINAGSYFLYEHPATATSWEHPGIQEILEHPGVHVVTGDICKWGMHLAEESENQGSDDAVPCYEASTLNDDSNIVGKHVECQVSGWSRAFKAGGLESHLTGSNLPQGFGASYTQRLPTIKGRDARC